MPSSSRNLFGLLTLPSAVISRSSQFAAASIVCSLLLLPQARAGTIHAADLVHDGEDRGSFSIALNADAGNQYTATIRTSHVEDRDAYRKKLTFKVFNAQGSGTSLGNLNFGNTLTGNVTVQDKHDDGDDDDEGMSQVPEPSSLLLMSAGFLGLGSLLKRRLGS